MLYIHVLSTPFSFLSTWYPNWLVKAWEECVHHPIKIFCFLCFSVNSVRISLLFLKKKQYSLESKEDWRICLLWGSRFSQPVCFILLRLVSLWALYTLKWTLVTLVLMGHYLTCESLRHNQLHFTFKDPLSDGVFPFYLLLHRPSGASWWL